MGYIAFLPQREQVMHAIACQAKSEEKGNEKLLYFRKVPETAQIR